MCSRRRFMLAENQIVLCRNQRWASFAIAATTAGFIAFAGNSACAAETIWKVTRGKPDQSRVANPADKIPRCYGVGLAAQLGPSTAALFCNRRIPGPKRWDFEDGTDVFVFNALDDLRRAKASPITHNERDNDPTTDQSRFLVKYPVAGGFWPLGAKRSDGSDHPGAGKGFLFCQALSFAGPDDALDYEVSPPKTYIEVLQLVFDGQRLSVDHRDLVCSEWKTPDGWKINAPGLQMAIPDGDDLLMALSAEKEGDAQSGVCRCSYAEGRWQPIAFTPVTSGYEPSLARGRDGSLIFTARLAGDDGQNRILLWRSSDEGRAWKQILRSPKVRTESPVSVHAAPDGRVFVAANVLQGVDVWGIKRSQLGIWPLIEGTNRLGALHVIRDCLKEFGPPSKAIGWIMDHPTSAILRLHDEQWHGLVIYRVMTFPGLDGVKPRNPEPILPETGCYVEEVLSSQPANPPWNF